MVKVNCFAPEEVYLEWIETYAKDRPCCINRTFLKWAFARAFCLWAPNCTSVVIKSQQAAVHGAVHPWQGQRFSLSVASLILSMSAPLPFVLPWTGTEEPNEQDLWAAPRCHSTGGSRSEDGAHHPLLHLHPITAGLTTQHFTPAALCLWPRISELLPADCSLALHPTILMTDVGSERRISSVSVSRTS